MKKFIFKRRCQHCDGTGYVKIGKQTVLCPVCRGKGHVED